MAQVYRSYIELGQHDVVQSEIGDDAPTALQAVKLLATYRSQKDMRDTVKANLTSWLSDSETGNNPTLQLVAGIIYMEEGDFEEAAKVPLLPSPPPPPLERFLILCLNLQHKIRLDQTRLDQIISSMLPLILPPRPD